jgi:glutaredoxin
MHIKIKDVLLSAAMLCITVAIAMPVGTIGAKYYDKYRGHSIEGDFSQHVDKLPFKLTLYGTSTCLHCKSAREHLNAAGIAFNDVLVDASPEAERKFHSLGIQGVPVLLSRNSLVSGYYTHDFDRIIRGSLEK